MSPKPRVMIAGGTGYVGGGVMRALHRHGYWIRALARNPTKLRQSQICDETFVAEATRPETLRGLCDGIDVVFSSVGIRSFSRKPSLWEVDYQANINVLNEARRAGVKHFLFITTVHAADMAKHSPIAEARQRVADAVMTSGMKYNIFAPTGFFNDMEEFFVAAKKRGTVMIFGEGEGLINPLCSLDLGDEIARVLEDPALWNTVREVGGPDTMRHKEVAEMAFRIVGTKPRYRHVPGWLLDGVATVARPFHPNLYAMLKFFEYITFTPDVTGEPIGHRHLEAFFDNLNRGMSRTEAEDAL